jgi:hypothetical protein
MGSTMREPVDPLIARATAPILHTSHNGSAQRCVQSHPSLASYYGRRALFDGHEAAHSTARDGAARGDGAPASDRAGVWDGAPR